MRFDQKTQLSSKLNFSQKLNSQKKFLRGYGLNFFGTTLLKVVTPGTKITVGQILFDFQTADYF